MKDPSQVGNIVAQNSLEFVTLLLLHDVQLLLLLVHWIHGPGHDLSFFFTCNYKDAHPPKIEIKKMGGKKR